MAGWIIKRVAYRISGIPLLSRITSLSGQGGGDVFQQIADALEAPGYIVLDRVLPAGLVDALFVQLKALDCCHFREAGVGREDLRQLNRFVRTDEIFWIEHPQGGVRSYLAWMEDLRLAINRRLFLGLFDYECHFARYAKGAFYKKHLDAFKGQRNRIVSTVLYLNPQWQQDHGGELLIYDREGADIIEKVAPVWGRLVVFLSEEFSHEVVATQQPRYSLTGWFRLNNTLGGALDPPN